MQFKPTGHYQQGEISCILEKHSECHFYDNGCMWHSIKQKNKVDAAVVVLSFDRCLHTFGLLFWHLRIIHFFSSLSFHIHYFYRLFNKTHIRIYTTTIDNSNRTYRMYIIHKQHYRNSPLFNRPPFNVVESWRLKIEGWKLKVENWRLNCCA